MRLSSFRPYLFILFSLLILACSQPEPAEKQIQQLIDKMQVAADERELASLMNHFHASFLGRNNMRKAQLQGLIYFHFRINPKVRVFISNTQITVTGEDAEVSCHLLVTGSQKYLPDRGRLFRVTSSLKKIDKQWKVVEAEWEDIIEETIEDLRR